MYFYLKIHIRATKKRAYFSNSKLSNNVFILKNTKYCYNSVKLYFQTLNCPKMCVWLEILSSTTKVCSKLII